MAPGFCAAMIAAPLLHAQGLTHFFGDFQAVKPLNLELNGHEMVLLTGPNGAGKSTLLLCLSGLLRPSRGSVSIAGYDLYRQEREAKRNLAFVPDVPHFYQELTTIEHVRFINLAFNNEEGWEQRAETQLREFGLWESRNMYPHNLSRGMRLKLGILLALSRPFKVLLLDEPTSALDTESVSILLEKLGRLRDDGCAVLLTSHNLSLAEALNARCLRMVQGQVEV